MIDRSSGTPNAKGAAPAPAADIPIVSAFLRTSVMILAMPSWRRRRMRGTWSRLRGVQAEHELFLREKGQGFGDA
jgi:hypothetical protein